jgi:peroxiredoxin
MYGDKLPEIQMKFGPLLKILSINAINPPQRAISEVEKYEMDFQVLSGRESGITKDYQVSNLPLLVIIDKNGIIRTYTRYLKYEDLKAAVIPWIKDIVGY